MLCGVLHDIKKTATMKKNVHWSSAIRIGSLVFAAAIAVCSYWLVPLPAGTRVGLWLGILLSALLWGSFLGAYAYAPLSVFVSEREFTLRRGLGHKTIPFRDIAQVGEYTGGWPAIRICGIGGVFGFIGRYYNREFGHYFSYVGDYSQSFYLKLKNGRQYVFSCEDHHEVVAFIKKHI